MKKLITLLLAAALTLGVSGTASAVDVKVFGIMDFGFEFYGNMGNNALSYTFMDSADVAAQGQQYHQKHSAAIQRLILGASFTISENLSAYYDGILGFFTWGGPTIPGAYPPQQQGGALGSRAANLISRQAYLDWIVPGTAIKLRMGLQSFYMPSFACGNPALASEFGTGITANIPINDTVSATMLWTRVASDSRRGTALNPEKHDDTLDTFALVLPIRLDGMQLVPWAAVGILGKGALSYNRTPAQYMPGGKLTPMASAAAAGSGRSLANADAGLSSSTAWWLGFSGELTKFDPFRFGVDMYYSDNGQREHAYQRKGWYASAAASYKTAWGVPTLKGWYASGDDGDVRNGSERPLFVNGGFSNSGANIFFANAGGNIEKTFENGTPGGTWGISLQWNNLSFMDKLFHSLRATYIKGTNSPKMAPYANPNYIFQYLTGNDSVIELDFDTTYSIYKNLAVMLQLSYLIQNFDENMWTASRGQNFTDAGGRIRFSNAWRASLLFRYTF